ncbi:hypothetical protein KKE45_00085 [Patescibacteria group bacterium]|nr:hypothetical protein [Patescibacteria group bacterium]
MNIPYPYIPKNKKILYVPIKNPFLQKASLAKKDGCFKHPTGAVVVKDGQIIGTGSNAGTKVKFCPREKKGSKTGEDYYLCKTFCKQQGHAEIMAIKNAQKNGYDTKNADLYLDGHWWCCKNCWDHIIKAGIRHIFLHKNSYQLYKK